ncbi:hypothetical protein EhVM1_000435 [Emiliania huxleyi virus M1]|nr:hypothetical protein EhVM1_000435 [Emiliania huxleyi virus M1]
MLTMTYAIYKTDTNLIYHDMHVSFGSKYCMSFRRTFNECSANGTIVVTTSSSNYMLSLNNLVKHTTQNGQFNCIVVFYQDDSPLLCNDYILPVKTSSTLLPDEFWCEILNKKLWGWARSQLYKTFALQYMLKQKYDVLLLDNDHAIVSDPIHQIITARQRNVDIIAIGTDDKRNMGYLNFGLSWTRNTQSTRSVAERLHNRTFRAWDQYLWNSEIDATDLSCCISRNKLGSIPNDQPSKLIKSNMHNTMRCNVTDKMSIGPPPSKHKVLGPSHKKWHSMKYNTLGWHGDRFHTTCNKMCRF